MGSPIILFSHLKSGSFLIFSENLMHWISEHSIDCLRIGRSGLPCKVSPRSVAVIKLFQLEVPSLVRDNLCFTFAQLLVFFNPFILVDPVHELVQAGDRLSC